MVGRFTFYPFLLKTGCNDFIVSKFLWFDHFCFSGGLSCHFSPAAVQALPVGAEGATKLIYRRCAVRVVATVQLLREAGFDISDQVFQEILSPSSIFYRELQLATPTEDDSRLLGYFNDFWAQNQAALQMPVGQLLDPNHQHPGLSEAVMTFLDVPINHMAVGGRVGLDPGLEPTEEDFAAAGPSRSRATAGGSSAHTGRSSLYNFVVGNTGSESRKRRLSPYEGEGDSRDPSPKTNPTSPRGSRTVREDPRSSRAREEEGEDRRGRREAEEEREERAQRENREDRDRKGRGQSRGNEEGLGPDDARNRLSRRRPSKERRRSRDREDPPCRARSLSRSGSDSEQRRGRRRRSVTPPPSPRADHRRDEGRQQSVSLESSGGHQASPHPHARSEKGIRIFFFCEC